MTRRTTALCIGALAAGGVLCGATDSRAGLSAPDAECATNSTGGYCYGTFAGFRNSSDSSASIEFYDGPYVGFTAELNGHYYACTVSPQAYPTVAAMWPQAMAARSYFTIYWDKNGNCSYLFLANGSQY